LPWNQKSSKLRYRNIDVEHKDWIAYGDDQSGRLFGAYSYRLKGASYGALEWFFNPVWKQALLNVIAL
jgi:hypothetical protein